MKTYVYHYCASYLENGKKVYLDGVVCKGEMINCGYQYRELKYDIHCGISTYDLVVESLSLLHILED